MKNWMLSWSLMRIVRLVLGLTIIGQGIAMQEWLFVGMGVLFTLMPLLNIGCCANGSCNNKLSKSKQDKEVTFTEIK